MNEDSEIHFEYGVSELFKAVKSFTQAKTSLSNNREMREMSMKVIRTNKSILNPSFGITFEDEEIKSETIILGNNLNNLTLKFRGNLLSRDPRKYKGRSRLVLYGLVWDSSVDLLILDEHLRKLATHSEITRNKSDKIILLIRMKEVRIRGEFNYLDRLVNHSEFTELLNLKLRKYVGVLNIITTLVDIDWEILASPFEIAQKCTHWVDLLKSQLSETYSVSLNLLKSQLTTDSITRIEARIGRDSTDEVEVLKVIPAKKLRYVKAEAKTS